MTPSISLRQALGDPNLLGDALSGSSWQRWRVLLIALMGEALRDDERVLFTELTGREREPQTRVDEACFIIGRRGGKSRAMATLAAYISGLCQHPLVRGEKGICLCIAPDLRQAAIVLDYCAAVFEASPILKQLIRSRTTDSLELTNGVSIEVRAASFRRLRGPTYIAVICDEAAFWYSEESSNPDTEIVNACRPGLATTGGPLIIASSPYARRGLLYELHKRHYGPDGDPLILVAQGASRVLHPTLPESVVARAYERDAASASAEYGAQFRVDIESFISREAVEACVSLGVRERPPVPGVRFFGFVDPSGGSADSMTLAVSHQADDLVVIDCVREVQPPFSPESCVEDFSRTLKTYGIHRICGDRYAGEWPVEQFRKHGIEYEQSAEPKTTLYQSMMPLLNSRRIELLDHPRLISQLCGLERRTSRGGRDSIDHPPNAHDDVVNAVAGAAAAANGAANELAPYLAFASDGTAITGRSYDAADGKADAAAEAAARQSEMDFLNSRLWAHIRQYGRS
jgi:hypothetical protein